MAMQLDMTAVRRAMQDAAKTAAGAEWPDVRDSVRRAIDGQLDYLQRLAHLYLCGELDEDTLDQHLAPSSALRARKAAVPPPSPAPKSH